ncbi:MAG TPA: ABC transporter ATP-binding protein [Kaistia sp.]|nr:ABC transporter ATP-binding protein [Kaistia sp.]
MSALIALEDVRVARDGTDVLHGASLSLVAGERLAIVGPNGAGKTTLLRTIVGLEKPASGTVRLFGAACGEERQFRQYRPRIGYLFQDSDDQLFCPTVIEDVAFGPLNTGCDESEAERRAAAALADLGIGHLAERVSHRLSGGEKRLVCLAGLLAMKPDVLLLDEPTNGVDNENGRRLRDALRAFPGAMLLVSHDAAFVADLATRAMIIEKGTLQPAEIHAHTHAHSHPHLHPTTPSRS